MAAEIAAKIATQIALQAVADKESRYRGVHHSVSDSAVFSSNRAERLSAHRPLFYAGRMAGGRRGERGLGFTDQLWIQLIHRHF